MSTSISFTHPVGTMCPGYVTRALMPYLIGRLGADGVTASLVVEPGDSSMFLVIKDLFRYNLSPLFVQLLEAPPISHKEILNRWADGVCNRIRIEAAQLANPNVLRQRVRTELVPSHTTQHPDFSYARPFGDGLSLILSIVHEAGASRCTTDGLRLRPLSVDELFHYGQANTDAAPITTVQPSGPTTCLSSQSPFIAAKAANMPALLARQEITAPNGLFVMLPQQHLLFYAPADPNNISAQLHSLVDFVRFPIMTRRPTTPTAP